MSAQLTRSTAEILRLTRAQWAQSPELYALLVDLTGVSSPPTAASSISSWIQYALTNPYADDGYTPVRFVQDSSFSYNTTLDRAQTGELLFNFNTYIAAEFSNFSSTTVTHVVFAALFDLSPSTATPQAVLQESTPLTLTSSSTLSYNIRLFGRAA
jgi:hypothetical protein